MIFNLYILKIIFLLLSNSDAVEAVKKAEKDKTLDKDSSKKYQDDLQKITDDYTKKVEELLKKKEKDLLTL